MQPKASSRNELLKIMGVGFGIAVTIGGTIGTGILRKPGPIAAQLGEPWLIMAAWLAVSIYALLGTICTIELGVSIPKAGAWYVYARRAFGNYTGFVVGINSWLGTTAALGFGAYTLGEYLSILWPSLEGYEPFTAVVILLLLLGVQSLGLAKAGTFQNIMSFIKAIGLLIFVIFCFVFGDNVTTADVATTTSKIIETGSWVAPVIFSLQAIFYTFDGWHTAAYFAEEDKDPEKNLPRSMIGSVLLIIVIYALCNLAIMYVLPMEVLSQSKLAAADAITVLSGEKSGKLITLFLMISIIGIVNVQMMFNPRVLFGLSRDHLFFKRFNQVNQGGTPYLATVFTVFVAIALIMAGKNTCEKLSDIATFFFVLGYASGFASLIALRIKEPALSRPWKAPMFPYLPALLFIISIAFLIGAIFQDYTSGIYAILFMALSYPLYRLILHYNTMDSKH
jgi:APA family basic amino acid/polyamine antiporter